MSETLLTFSQPVSDGSGTYVVRAVGRQAPDRMWEGWLEFLPVNREGDAIIGSVESRQPEHEHLVYWATGLTPIYLEGALHRARAPLNVRVRAEGPPLSDAPAAKLRRTATEHPRPEAVLDPFEIGARNLDLLRQELTALNRARLLNIIEAHDLNPAREDIAWMSTTQLIHFIVVAVDTQLPQRLRL
jgi:hypothetical protein